MHGSHSPLLPIVHRSTSSLMHAAQNGLRGSWPGRHGEPTLLLPVSKPSRLDESETKEKSRGRRARARARVRAAIASVSHESLPSAVPSSVLPLMARLGLRDRGSDTRLGGMERLLARC